MSKFTVTGNKIDFHCRFCGAWSPFDYCCAEGNKEDAATWTLMAHEINWEDHSLYCDHCNSLIESAYKED